MSENKVKDISFSGTAAKQKRSGKCKRVVRGERGIDNWDQVDSVLREIAELQVVIDTKNKAFDGNLAFVKNSTQEVTGPALARWTSLRLMVEDFLRKHCSYYLWACENDRVLPVLYRIVKKVLTQA